MQSQHTYGTKVAEQANDIFLKIWRFGAEQSKRKREENGYPRTDPKPQGNFT
jgi:hypothetical protein